jgi:hypothetical protein
MNSVGSAHLEHWTMRSDFRPRRVRVVDDALRSGSTAPEREGGRYLGIPQKRLQCPVQCHPEAPASGSRDSPNIETSGTAQRFQIWVMRGISVITAAETNRVKAMTTEL